MKPDVFRPFSLIWLVVCPFLWYLQTSYNGVIIALFKRSDEQVHMDSRCVDLSTVKLRHDFKLYLP